MLLTLECGSSQLSRASRCALALRLGGAVALSPSPVASPLASRPTRFVASSSSAASALPSHLDAAQLSAWRHTHHPPGVQRLAERHGDIPVERCRTFSIVAHVDHGKSTLSDALLVSVGNVWPTVKGQQQVLDTLDVERQRGITVKAQSASFVWTHPGDGLEYLFNLIDTPGHVDFAYEVSRSLAACQGALLVVDCGQGVQAQTVANHNAAAEAALSIIPVLTKIDLPAADPEPALLALQAAFGVDPDTVLWTSAKTGEGIADVLPAIVARVPPPGTSARRAAPLRALLVDSYYDVHRGVVLLVQIIDGVLRPGDVLVSCATGEKCSVQEVGLLAPHKCPIAPGAPGLGAGCMGYVYSNMKSVKQARVGDTFALAGAAAVEPLPGFRAFKPMVFASLYPVDTGLFADLALAVDRLTLNDASVTVERESSQSLGFGLRCGFLGLLHMDVFVQRLRDEFTAECIVTAPMVSYRLRTVDGRELTVERPDDFPPPHTVEAYYEPTAHVSIVAPARYLSEILAALEERRGEQEDVVFLSAASAGGGGAGGAAEGEPAGPPSAAEPAAPSSTESSVPPGFVAGGTAESVAPPGPAAPLLARSADRVSVRYRVPWSEVVTGLYDEIKSATQGFASVDYLPGEYAASHVVKVDVLIQGKPLDALCFVTHRDKALAEGRRVVQRLKGEVERQQFEIAIQAAINGKIVARERIPPFRKDVLIKSGKTVGGGDVSRKQKLLSKQREGKRRMKSVGDVQLSQEAFHAVMTDRGAGGR